MSLGTFLAEVGKTTRTTSTTYNNSWTRDNLLKGKQQSTTFAAAFQEKQPSLLRLLADEAADIGKTTRTTSTTYNYASPGQLATHDTNLLQGKQQRTTSRSLELPCFRDQGADATDGYSVALQRWA